MIEVRDIFQIKFGKIDQAVDLFKRLPAVATAQGAPLPYRYNVLTDISGAMYTLVTELTFTSLAEWEITREQQYSRAEFAEWFRGFEALVETGRQEYYTVEGECEHWSRPGVVIIRQLYRALKWQIRPAVGLLQRYGALMVDSGVGRNPRVLTDLSGPMFTAVIEIETSDMAEWETRRRSMFLRPEFQVWFLQLCNHVDAGAHEFYRVEL